MNKFLLCIGVLSMTLPATSGLYDCKIAWTDWNRIDECVLADCTVASGTCATKRTLEGRCHYDPWNDCVDWDPSNGGIAQYEIRTHPCHISALGCSCDESYVISISRGSERGYECDGLNP